MTTNPEKHVDDWLRDAHAMEMQALTMMESLVARLEHYPELRSRIQQHIEETRVQAKRLEGCIESRGGDTSALKDMTGKATAMMQGMSGLFASDEVMKGSIASYAFEHMEIASYRILAAGAEALGDRETAQVCRENLREEEAMAEWLLEHMEPTTTKYLEREMAGAEAKR